MADNRRSYLYYAIWVAVIAIHIFLVLRQYPVSTLRDGNMPIKGDTARYIATAEGVYRTGGIGYDPMAMAGYPVGLWNSMGKKGYEILGGLIPVSDLGLRFYILFVTLSVLLPVFAWILIIPIIPGVCKTLVLLGIMVCWHLDSQTAYFWAFGNILYPGTACLLPGIIFLSYRACVYDKPWASAIGLGLLTSWQIYAHTALVIAWVPVVTLTLIYAVYTRRSIKPAAWMTAAAGLSIALTGGWLWLLYTNRTDCVPSPKLWFQSSLKHLTFDIFNDRVYQRNYDRNFTLQATFILCVLNIYHNKPRFFSPLTLTSLTGFWCLAISYTFSNVELFQSVQPYRFLIPALFCMLPSAIMGISAVSEIFISMTSSQKLITLCLLLILVPRFTGQILDLPKSTIACGLTQDQRNLLDAIKKLDGQGRVLCEPETVGYLIPLWCNKPVLGGLNDQAFLKHRKVGIILPNIYFGKAISDWDPKELLDVCEKYAVQHIVVNNKESIDFFDNMSDHVKKVDVIAKHHIYTITRHPVNYILSGKARFEIKKDRFVFNDIDDYVVLKYHYSPFLRASPNLRIEAVIVDEDFPPLLGVHPIASGKHEIRFGISSISFITGLYSDN